MKTILGLVFLVAGIGLVIGVVLPWWDEIAVLKATAADRRGIVEQIESTRTLQDELLGRYKNISNAQLSALSAFLPEKPEQVELLLAIQNIARARNMALSNIGFGSSERQKGVASTSGNVQVTLVVAGSYESFRAFLSDLEQSLRLMDVRSLTFTASGKNAYTFNLTVTGYFLDRAAAVPSPEAL